MSKLFTFTSRVFGGSTEGTLNLYLRSTAGHKVTVEYVYTDDESKNDSKFENVKYAEEKSFGKLDKDYGYEITVSSGDAKYEVNSLDVLRVTGGAENSEITVTYTPKDVIYIDQYYDNGKLWVKWTGNNIKVNGPELLKGAAEAAVIEGEDLTDAVENYRFLTVNGVTYDFSFASLVPVKGRILQPITDVWYDRDEGTWYYSHTDRKGLLFGLGDRVPVVNRGCVNFCYNTPHDQNSKHHDFVATTTVEPTCTEKGYTDYECRYCGKEGQRVFTDPLNHKWEWKHVDGTEKENSQHQQVCKRCNQKENPENCNFKSESTETGTKYTCTVCGYSYTDEVTPTGTPVYVYFQTVHPIDGNVKVNDGVTYNNNTGNNNTGEKWATLGKLTTKLEVNASNKDALGAEVKDETKFVKHQDNENFNLDLISEWVELKKDNGAAGYVKEAPFSTEAWHLNGKVNVYKLSYDANLPTGVTETVTGMPKPAYYLPNWNATVSTADPTLQGYDFGGWYTEKTCEHKVEKTVTVSEDTVLYAKWTPAQPTTDFGSVVITTTKPELKETVDLSGGAYEVPYTATYTMSDKLLRMLKAAPSGVPMTFVVELDSRLTAKKDAATDKFLYTFDGDGILEVDESKITVSSDGHTITVVCNPVTNWAAAVEDKTSVVMTLKGTGVLAATDFAAGEYLNTTGHIEGAIPVGGTLLPVKIPANICQTKMTAQTYTVTYDGNGADSGKTTDNTAYATGTTATVKENNYTRGGYTFTGWNTKADGSGTPYKTGDWITMTGSVILYAQWTRNSSHGGDDDDKYFFAIQKVDAQDGHALNGAKFELYQLDKNDRIVNRRVVKTTQQGNKSGIALFSVDNKKSYDGIWYYAEVSAPEGYVLDRTEYEINHKDFSDSLSTAVKYADTVRNYRGTTPDLLNDSDHFAYVIGYMDGNVRPYGLISRAETTTIFFRLLKDSVRDGNLLTSNTYTDVADDYWANTAISTMTGLGIVQGRSTTTFDPKAPITRAQFAAICARFDTGKSNGEQTFSDISGHWAEKYIQRAAELGWIKGFEDGTFRPDTYITRAQAMTMINRVLNRIPEDESDLLPGMNVWPDCNPGDWFYLAVQEATNSHDYRHKAGSYEIWTGLNADPDWTRYEN
ncbi:S-layer homology domain-containing protein [Dysosmobacter sp.]|uniref:S-layer homology domain-containing protein n=1 Tax=Dysosmobacter sp. TaxID=2591382 RepID=UPI002670EC25|nr:S-layer homology domain-containing protein [Dysosmobacter sp.]MCI7281064.1 S-layer homology domain-containing protein [Dysosmobacter sp.]